MTDDEQLPDHDTESGSDQAAWPRLKGWTRKHRNHLLAVGVGLTAAAAVVARARGAGGGSAVVDTAKAAAAAAAKAADAAAEASSRVIGEYEALGRDYIKAAMDQTVAQAPRRFQRWTPEEMEVLRDAGKTALEKALVLGRTFEGVKAKSIKEGLSSKVP